MPSGTNIIYKKNEDKEIPTKKLFKIDNEQKGEKSKEEIGNKSKMNMKM